jgi:hypothetical protein
MTGLGILSQLEARSLIWGKKDNNFIVLQIGGIRIKWPRICSLVSSGGYHNWSKDEAIQNDKIP